MSLIFKPTHKILVKAINEREYEVLDIDIHNGTFKRSNIKMTETKIRVNKSILGEILMSGGITVPIKQKDFEGITKDFNAVRVTAGFTPIEFRLTEENPKTTDAILKQLTRDLIPLE